MQQDSEKEFLKHFDVKSVSVKRKSQHEDKDALGMSLSNEQVAALSGAPSGSEVYVEFVKDFKVDACLVNGQKKVEIVPCGLYLKTKNEAYIEAENEVILTVEEKGEGIFEHGIYIKRVDFRSGSNKRSSFVGIGGLMVAQIVRAAREAKIFRVIRLEAAGGRTWQDRNDGPGRWYGYVAWPRYGFDMRLKDFTKMMFPHFPHQPANLSACDYVSQVLALGKDGEAFWRAVGDGWNMEFSIEPKYPYNDTLSKAVKFEV